MDDKDLQLIEESQKAQTVKARRIDEILSSPDILSLFVNEFDKVIPAQEEQKKLLILALASSRCVNLGERPHLLINSESSAGKSFFARQFQWLLQNEEFEYYTRLSPKVLAYLHPESDWTWDNKVLFLEDVTQELLDSDVFKVFASEGARTAVVDKGKARTIQINGTPTIILTSAAGLPKNEILNRFILLNLDESEEQTREILRSTARQEKPDDLYYEAFCQLARCKVVIPYVGRIAERFPTGVVRARRDFQRFLSLIKASAILHQKQRKFDDSDALVAEEQDFHVAMQLFAYTNPASFEIDLTHTQKKAYTALVQLAAKRRRPSVSRGVQNAIYDDDGHLGNTVATACECGSVHLSRSCIHTHCPERTLRKWDELLERLAAKGAVEIKTITNPTTKREITVYCPKKMDTIGTFDIFSNNEDTDSTTTDSSIMDSSELVSIDGAHYPSSTDVKKAKETPMDTVVLLQDLPAWRGADGEVYGAFSKGQQVTLLRAEADWAVKAGFCVLKEVS